MMRTTDLDTLVTDALGGRVPWRLIAAASGATSCEVAQVTDSTRGVAPGALFVCVVGQQHDGHEFAAVAVEAGAVAVVVQRALDVAVPQIVVADSRRALGLLCAAQAGWPSHRLEAVGVTGTNGKTSTSHLLAHILGHAGRQTSVRGTLTGTLTTPEAPELQQWFAQRVEAGDRHVVMEVSSHALELQRVAGTRFALGVFTNLGHDHLDFHGTQERYFAAKASLFTPEYCAAAVVNRDDVHGRLLADVTAVPVTTFGLDDISDVRVDRFGHQYRWRDQLVTVPLGGEFHVMNSLASATAAAVLGVDEAVVAEALGVAPTVRGRFEVIDREDGPTVVVDFAHTPEGLEQVLRAARRLTGAGRLIVVFGCGGDRDAPKRPRMGAVAAGLADTVILTSDNPRSEDPLAIMEAIRRGVDEVDPSRLGLMEPDRRRAIAAALGAACSGDVIVVAGKGHETTQTIGDLVVPFDDAAVVAELLGATRAQRSPEGAR